jgi:hypothetical protein
LAQNNSQKKRGEFYKHLPKLLRIKLSKREILFIIGLLLLLQIHNKRCTLHGCSSYVEILDKLKFETASPHFLNLIKIFSTKMPNISHRYSIQLSSVEGYSGNIQAIV